MRNIGNAGLKSCNSILSIQAGVGGLVHESLPIGGQCGNFTFSFFIR